MPARLSPPSLNTVYSPLSLFFVMIMRVGTCMYDIPLYLRLLSLVPVLILSLVNFQCHPFYFSSAQPLAVKCSAAGIKY